MKCRILYKVVWLLVVISYLWSCQDETAQSGDMSSGNVLTLNMETRAVNTEPGEDIYHENTIRRADVFFFSSAEGECIYAQTGLTPLENNRLQVELGEEIKEGESYYVYVVANYDLKYTPETAKGQTIADIQGHTIYTQWKTGLTDLSDVIEEALVMDGGAQITVSTTQSASVSLQRAMAKIAVFPTAEESIEVGEGDSKVTYTPVFDRMNVTLVNAVKSTNLAGTYTVKSGDYEVRMKRGFSANEQDGTYTQVPFYSYPNPESTTDRKESYLILCLPWNVKGQNSDQALNYYYRVPITKADVPAELERNNYYKVKVNVGVLGSLDPKDAVTLESSFVILDWNTMEIDANMQNYQYLVLDEYNSVMNNVDELEMPYISSSEIDWSKTKIMKVTYPDYNKNEDGIVETITLNENEISQQGFKLEASGNNLRFSHDVTNEDYVPYTITVKVFNTQGIEADTWTIVQYPAIYIEGEYNENGLKNRFVYGDMNSLGLYNTDDEGQYLGSFMSPVGGMATNHNQSQYTIYITSFDVGDDYVIGDPRSEAYNTFNLTDKADKAGKNLTYYYPTKQTEDVKYMVAPVFKVASSWGVAAEKSLTFETAQERCAAYQENGYPAGRWRVPTEAEINYILGLSEKGKIPILFDGEYFASSGRYLNNYSGSGNDNPTFILDETKHIVRCVYDVWYWGDDKIANPNVFTWGDEERK